MSLEEHFKVGNFLDTIREEVGESEFGYRVQGLLAHVFLRLGGRIIAIKAQGHPDIIVNFGSRTLLLQAKSIHGKIRRQKFVIAADDLEGIRSFNANEVGYLAVLDCALPPSWILVNYHKLLRQQLIPIHMITLKAMSDRQLSFECTEEFVKLVIRHQNHLRNLNFHILCSRAIKGEAL